MQSERRSSSEIPWLTRRKPTGYAFSSLKERSDFERRQEVLRKRNSTPARTVPFMAILKCGQHGNGVIPCLPRLKFTIKAHEKEEDIHSIIDYIYPCAGHLYENNENAAALLPTWLRSDKCVFSGKTKIRIAFSSV